jgi:hypothetical protein
VGSRLGCQRPVADPAQILTSHVLQTDLLLSQAPGPRSQGQGPRYMRYMGYIRYSRYTGYMGYMGYMRAVPPSPGRGHDTRPPRRILVCRQFPTTLAYDRGSQGL